MKVISDFEIDENKWKEFLYVFFKDNFDTVLLEVCKEDGRIEVLATNGRDKIYINKEEFFSNQVDVMQKLAILKLYDISVPWGTLVGVRPTKLARKLLEKYDEFKVEYILESIYGVSRDKAKLLLNVVKNSKDFLDKESISVYIGFAYCPTKCSYCSFPAYLKRGKYNERYDEYFEKLLKETEEVGKLCKELKININSIYVGGGTPSYLELSEMDEFLKTIQDNFDFKNIKEYTFEAGRIDTLDENKLNLMKKYGVSRISINPQSFKEETLKLVNRYHDIDKLNEVYTISKNLGFDINMDFIIGLPKESTEDILNTLEKFKEYSPENVTFHYLALKNASNLTMKKHSLTKGLDYEKIESKIKEITQEKGYIPYYLYRQKNSFDFGENLGYCFPGKQLIYNIEMIEENKSVIAIGAGGITKIIKDGCITRQINSKDPLMWLNEFEDRLNKKLEIIRGLGEKN